MNTRMTELTCQYDSRNSFYGKAIIATEDNVETLCSYCVPVVRYDRSADKVITFYSSFTESATTLRHVKEYLKQLRSPMGDMTKAELVKYANENGLMID